MTPSEHGRSAPPVHTLRLILGDQLDPQHPWFARVDPGVLHVMMEMRQETDYVLHHAQKILAICARRGTGSAMSPSTTPATANG